jgi:hypothetical protein
LVQQTTAFFNKMAFEIDILDPTRADGSVSGTAQAPDPRKPRFVPMRRKLILAGLDDA